MASNSTQREANFYRLSGDGVSVTYSTSSLNGQPRLNYHDSAGAKAFAGGQILSQDTQIGTMVSVFLSRIADGDSTIFSVLLPTVRLPGGQNSPIQTLGFVTLDRDTLMGPPLGQDESYTVKALTGTAAHVEF